jgi:hypothetical protein
MKYTIKVLTYKVIINISIFKILLFEIYFFIMWCRKIISHINSKINKNLINNKIEKTWEK